MAKHLQAPEKELFLLPPLPTSVAPSHNLSSIIPRVPAASYPYGSHKFSGLDFSALGEAWTSHEDLGLNSTANRQRGQRSS